MIRFVVRGGLVMALLGLAACGSSDDGGGSLATDLGAPCLTVFDAAGDNAGGAAALLGKASSAGTVDLSSASCTPDVHGNVTIGSGKCGPVVAIDKSFTAKTGNALGKITIEAGNSLVVPRIIGSMPLEVETAGIAVAGVLSVGTSSCPVGHSGDPKGHVKFTFTGTQAPSNPATDSGADKGIELQKGGSLHLFGAKGVAPLSVNWTALSKPAGPKAYQQAGIGITAPVADQGESTLYLAADVTKGGSSGWQVGDWIVVATSSFSPFESEFVQIAGLQSSGSGSVVTLAQPLRHYHFGRADPGLPSDANYNADASTNFGVDERSEVGLISRSITFTASTPAPSGDLNDQNSHWGGEIRILAGYSEASIQGVELEKFGKARLGSYPIHFHMTGPAGPHLIDSNSIHHSYNKCVTVHMASGVNISNNVCARAIGHLYYQEIAQEQGGKFIGNLGLGAMSHNFGLADNVRKTPDGLVMNFWEGDNQARINGYDGLNVPNTDNQFNPSHGSCYRPDGTGALVPASAPPCADGTFYTEQSSGFWIGNPGTVLQGNSIGGCQGSGKAYWYVPPKVDPLTGVSPKNETVSFLNNRAHACFDGVFGEEEAPVVSEQMFPTVDGLPTSNLNALNVVAHFKGLTATRIRNRGLWVRPMWSVVESSRFATNRESVTLVSSGGTDGNGPGVWSMLKDSVLVGLSTNNVDRWGPCPPTSGKGLGCVDGNPKANDILDKAYQGPGWNSAGFMIYDGPVRIIHNHFINYRVAPAFTEADKKTLDNYRFEPKAAFPNLPAPETYEGDAALGWFQSNQSAYPTATVTQALSFTNTDLRHQIYTDRVNVNSFKDGDKNTALIDLDGTLTGYQVVDANGVRVPDEYPISLNNLPFNRNGNAVDECLATGAQDTQFENRATSLISPANMASLEFEALYPLPATWQDMIFSKDNADSTDGQGHGVHETMQLQSRNGLGVWEPKVASGASYSVRTAPSTANAVAGIPPQGMPKIVRVGFTDAVKSHMDTKPFSVRVGICYSNTNGAPPNGDFTITRGYKSWGGNGTNTNNATLQKYFTLLNQRYKQQFCINLDAQNQGGPDVPGNFTAGLGCPAAGVTLVPDSGSCPAGSTPGSDRNNLPICVYAQTPLSATQSMADITNADGTPNAADKYYFDKTTGMLYFNVQQTAPNAKGAAPLGSCRGLTSDDPSCPGANELETYYPCPVQGCTNYSVTVNDPSYAPGPSTCDALAGGSIYGKDGKSGFTTPDPVITNRLGYAGQSGPSAIVTAVQNPSTANGETFLRWTPKNPPNCPQTTPIAPPVPIADAGRAARSARPWFEVAKWVRDGLAVVSASATVPEWGKEWFSARKPPVPDIGALMKICTAAPA
jgi:hypothetical protein